MQSGYPTRLFQCQKHQTLNAFHSLPFKLLLEGGQVWLQTCSNCLPIELPGVSKFKTLLSNASWNGQIHGVKPHRYPLSFTSSHPNRCAGSLGWLSWLSVFSSGFSLQQFKEQFVHRHAAVLFDAAEVLHSTSSRLTEERKGHDQFASSPRVLWVVGDLVVL